MKSLVQDPEAMELNVEVDCLSNMALLIKN